MPNTWKKAKMCCFPLISSNMFISIYLTFCYRSIPEGDNSYLFSLTNSHSRLIAVTILGMNVWTNFMFSWVLVALQLYVLVSSVNAEMNKRKCLGYKYSLKLIFRPIKIFISFENPIIQVYIVPSIADFPSNSTKHKRTVSSSEPCKKSDPGSN